MIMSTSTHTSTKYKLKKTRNLTDGLLPEREVDFLTQQFLFERAVDTEQTTVAGARGGAGQGKLVKRHGAQGTRGR